MNTLLAAVEQDLRLRPIAEVTEIFLGDYIDRGPSSAGVIEALSRGPKAGRNRLCLMGNHESIMLTFLTTPDVLPRWINVGGSPTLKSYGINLHPTAVNAFEIQRQFRLAMPRKHLNFLRTLPTMHHIDGYAFVHAGVRPGVPLIYQRDEDLMWIRHEFLDYTGDFGALVIHGHTPHSQIELKPNRINIDTGVYITGKLTCAVLDSEGLRFLQTDRGQVQSFSASALVGQ